MDQLSGTVERITYYNPENGYSVLRLRPDSTRIPGLSRDGLVTVTGNLPDLSAGEHLRLSGHWQNHAKHGLQFQSEVCEQTLPATVEGIRRYLGSGLIKGIGPGLANRIVECFGLDTLEVIENQPEKLLSAPDIGPKRAKMIRRAWLDQKQVKEIMVYLHSYGVTTNLAVKIYKEYGEEALNIVQLDPYRLARDIRGVGFKTADKIAQSQGLPADDPKRVEAGVVYTLSEMANDGHVFAPEPELAEKSSELLGVSAELIAPAVDRLVGEARLKRELLAGQAGPTADGAHQVGEARPGYAQPVIYLAPFYYGERGAAERLKLLASALPTRLSDLPPAFIRLEDHLSPEQQEGIRKAISHPVSVITGGPGTGKTTCLKGLIQVLQAANKRFALASPTGRAAKRLGEATGHPAATIHRLLGFKPGKGFDQDEQKPLDVDLLVVDEASMLDVLLANNLLKAVSPGTHLLLVGDVDQLPSVGAGDVLRDVIASGAAPVTRLSVIFRQAEGSQIIVNAHRINRGLLPEFAAGQGDFFLFPAETAEQAGTWVEDLVSQRIPQKFGFHPAIDIQVLAPMYRGPAGVTAINARLQAALNPSSLDKLEKALYGTIYRMGDKVMQTRNDYDKEIFNGDMGRVMAINPVAQTLTVNFEGRPVEFDWSETDSLTLAYCVSVHKSQGSEFPVVVIPLLTQHYMMLQRNLLYTAITRAKSLCVIVGSRKAISIAVKNNQVTRRHTGLKERLQAG